MGFMMFLAAGMNLHTLERSMCMYIGNGWLYGDTHKVSYSVHAEDCAVVRRDGATPYEALGGLLYIQLSARGVCI